MTKQLSNSEIQSLRKTQGTLLRIQNGEKFFFNVTVFRNLGLVDSRDNYYNDASGNKVKKDTSWFLTAKGKRILAIVI